MTKRMNVPVEDERHEVATQEEILATNQDIIKQAVEQGKLTIVYTGTITADYPLQGFMQMTQELQIKCAWMNTAQKSCRKHFKRQGLTFKL